MTVSAALAAIRSTYDLLAKAVEVRDDIKIREIRFALLSQILEAKEEAFELQEVNTALKERIAALMDRAAELEREISRLHDLKADIEQNYERCTLGFGATLYRSKPGVANGNAPEYLCANCVSGGKKTYLQPIDAYGTLKCPVGHGEFRP